MILNIIFLFNKKIIFKLFFIYMILYITFSKSFSSNLIKNGKQLLSNEKFPNIKESFNKAKNFLYKCLRGILTKNKIFT